MVRRLQVITAIGLLATAMSLTGCWHGTDGPAGYRGVDTRTQAAEAAASAPVAAAASRQSAELDAAMPGSRLSNSRSNLIRSIPPTFAADPIRYEVRFASDPETSDEVTGVVSLDDDPRTFEVQLQWQQTASRSVWRSGSYVDVPGDWIVTRAKPLPAQ